MAYRVIQWGTGNVGAASLRSIIRHSDYDLVGCYVSTPGKSGRDVGELIGEAQLIYNWEASADDVAPLVHAHPTQNEALGEAFLALAGKPLHAHA